MNDTSLPPRTASRSIDSAEVRFRILRLIEANPDSSQRVLARETDVSVGRVNYCLKALVEKGEVKIRNFRSFDKKLRYSLCADPQGDRRQDPPDAPLFAAQTGGIRNATL